MIFEYIVCCCQSCNSVVFAAPLQFATLSLPSGVGTIVAVVAMIPAAVSELIPAFIRIGYSVASRITARFDALGITSESRFPSKNTIGTSIYTDLILLSACKHVYCYAVCIYGTHIC